MSRQRIPPAPAGLSAASVDLWPRLVADCRAVGSSAEADMLARADLLRAMERLAEVRAAIDKDGPVVAGSMGQPRAHPLLAIELALRDQVAAAFDRLALSPGERLNCHVSPTGRLVAD